MAIKYIFFSYMIFINLITFVVRGIDKWKASNQKRRIEEKTLLILTGIGGFVGAIIGTAAFHHKTIKGAFLRKFFVICLAWLVITIFLAYKMG